MPRDPIARHPAYVAAMLLLVIASAVSFFGPLWLAILIFLASVGSFLVARRQVRSGE